MVKRLLCKVGVHYWLQAPKPQWWTCRWCGEHREIWDTRAGP